MIEQNYLRADALPHEAASGIRSVSMRRLRNGVALSSLALATFALPAAAQEVGAPAASQTGDTPGAMGPVDDYPTIVVTGSRIARPDLEASSPVSVVSQRDFKVTNSQTAEKLLSEIPQFTPAATSTVNNGSPGAATVDLRGLGEVRTLVLVNGKRMVSYDYNGIVDVNAIPVSLIKRVDVLTGGASAVYGSDAVAGVVNFILDDEFTGLQADASMELTSRGDGKVWDGALTGGVELGDRGNIVASVGYTKREVLYQSARDYSQFVLSSDDLVSAGGSSTTFPTNFDNTFVTDDNSYYQIGPSGDLVPYYQPYNYGPPNYLVTPQERWTGTLLAKYALTDGVEFFGRGSYLRSKVNSQSAPTGTFGYTFDIYPDNPYLTAQQRSLFFGPGSTINPDGSTTVGIRRRIVESGGRTTTYDNEAWQAVGGLRGEVSNLDWEVFAQYSKVTRDIEYLNDITYAGVAQALDARLVGGEIVCRDPSNGCVPINLFSPDPISATGVGFITANGGQSDTTEQFVAGVSLAGDLGNVTSPFATRPVAFAVGAEYRKEKAKSDIDAAYASGDLIGYGQGQVFPAFSYDVKEVFGELKIPVVTDRPFLDSINIELGARFSDYSTVGSVFSWKAGGDWTPVQGVRFRGMYQRAVRAPNIYEASAPQLSGIDNLDTDPCSGAAPTTDAALAALCTGTGAPASQIGRIAGPVSGQINAFYGGNLNLSAEKSDTYTLGVVINPPSIRKLTLSVDYYDISINNAIDSFGGSPQNVVDGCYLVTQDLNSPFCQAIHRNTVTGSLSGGIEFGVDQYQANSSVLATRGIDVSASYGLAFGDTGSVAFAFNGNYVDSFTKQGVDFIEPTQCAGKFGFACNLAPMPKWHHVFATTVGMDGVAVTGRWRYIGAIHQDAGTNILASRISPYSYFDVTVSADVMDRFTFRLGVENLFDKDPPLVGADAGGTAYNSANTFPTVYDALGTTFFASVTAKLF